MSSFHLRFVGAGEQAGTANECGVCGEVTNGRVLRCQQAGFTLDSNRCDLHRNRDHPWRRQDSNPRPSACRADALPTELHPHETGWRNVRDSNSRPRVLRGSCLAGKPLQPLGQHSFKVPGDEFRGRPIIAAGFRFARESQSFLPGCGGGLRSRGLQDMNLASYQLLYSASSGVVCGSRTRDLLSESQVSWAI